VGQLGEAQPRSVGVRAGQRPHRFGRGQAEPVGVIPRGGGRHHRPWQVAGEVLAQVVFAAGGVQPEQHRPHLAGDPRQVGVAGQLWLCDWNWPVLAAAWIDLAVLLPTVHAAGIDADAVLAAHPVSRDTDPDAVNAVLAAFAGMFLASSAGPPPNSASPWLRAHQRYYAQATLIWLRSRLG